MKQTIHHVHRKLKVLTAVYHAELLASGEMAFDHLRRGTRRRQGAYPYVWEDGVTGDSPSIHDSQILAEFAALRARQLLEQGKAREAAQLMLDTCRFAEDLGMNGAQLHHRAAHDVAGIALEDLRTILVSGELDREELLGIERELGLLADAWPDMSEAAGIEVLLAGYELLKPTSTRATAFCAALGDSWKFGFSRRLAEVDGYEQARYLVRKAAGLNRRPWREADPLSTELEARTSENPNPLGREILTWSHYGLEADRATKTRFQLLRGAVRYRATGEVAALDDPFGEKLRTEVKEGRLRIWSVRSESVNNGGVVEWKRGAENFVLEVGR